MFLDMTWANLLIIAGVIALVLIIVGKLWNFFKRFVQIWIVVVVVLIVIKVVHDAGWM